MKRQRRLCPAAALVVICLAAFGVSAAGLEAAELDRKLAAAAGAFLQTIRTENSSGRELAIAVVPLTEEGQEWQRKIGVTAANIIERHLTEGKPEWLTVEPRLTLPSITEAQKLWIGSLTEEASKRAEAPEKLLGRANLLVVGTTSVHGTEAKLELRLVLAGLNPKIIDTRSIRLRRAAIPRELLRFVTRGKGAAGSYAAEVSEIKLAITAQRRIDPVGGGYEEWEVKDGDTLRNRDQFKVQFSTDADAYVYLFMFGSDRKAALLYPSKELQAKFKRTFGYETPEQDNYCRAEWVYFAPGYYRDSGEPIISGKVARVANGGLSIVMEPGEDAGVRPNVLFTVYEDGGSHKAKVRIRRVTPGKAYGDVLAEKDRGRVWAGDAVNNEKLAFYRLDDTPGRNTLYVCADRKKVRSIPDILRRLGRTRTDQRRLELLEGKFDYVKPFAFEQR